jgi:large subunit ribosomal protein L31
MKTDTHPEYFTDAKITCANCKNVLVTGATIKEQNVEICSKCHPFYTGKKVLIDTEGRVDKFMKKSEGATGKKKKLRKKKTLEERMNEEIAAQLEEAKKAA